MQARSATPTMLAAMAGRIEAQHRWCVTGTPLSLERGVADAYDLLRFLQCSHPLARDRARFLRAPSAAQLIHHPFKAFRAQPGRTSCNSESEA